MFLNVVGKGNVLLELLGDIGASGKWVSGSHVRDSLQKFNVIKSVIFHIRRNSDALISFNAVHS